MGVKEDVQKVRGKVADVIRGERSTGLGWRSKAADIVEGRRRVGLSVASRVKSVVRGVRGTGLRRTGSLMLQGERPFRRWANIGPRRKYVETGTTIHAIEDSSAGGAMTREYRVGATNPYLDDKGGVRVRNIQS